jgi:hypothetical protein
MSKNGRNRRYSKEYRAEAVELAKQYGVANALKRLAKARPGPVPCAISLRLWMLKAEGVEEDNEV